MSAQTPTAPEYAPTTQLESPFLHIVRVFVKFTQGLFAQCPPGAYQWKPERLGSQDSKSSEIYIGADTPLRVASVGDRPAITVLRGPGAFQGVGIGDQAYIDSRTGAMVRMDVLPTTIMLNVLSRLPHEAESLAWFVAQHIWLLREELMRGESNILYLGDRPTITPATPAGSLIQPDTEHNWTVCTVSYPVYLQYSMTKMPLGKPVVKGFSVDASTSEAVEKAKGVVPLQGSAVYQPSGDEQAALNPEALPLNTENERQSTEPLTVRIKA